MFIAIVMFEKNIPCGGVQEKNSLLQMSKER